MATQTDNTNTGVVTTIVVVGAFAMISISAMVTAMVRSAHTALDAERPTNADLDTVAALDKDQLAKLTAPPAYLSGPGSKLHIPIEKAMDLVVQQYKQHPEAASPAPPPGMQMPPAVAPPPSPGATPAAPTPPGATPGGPAPAGAPAPQGAAPAAAAPGHPVPATHTPATPNPATPDPNATKRVVPPPAAPGPAATPKPGGRP